MAVQSPDFVNSGTISARLSIPQGDFDCKTVASEVVCPSNSSCVSLVFTPKDREPSALANLVNTASLKTYGTVIGSSVCPIAANIITIKRNFLLLHPQKAKVLQPISIKVQFIEDGFVATSHISDIYELGDTFSQAVQNYLSSLVDDLIWFQQHKQSLSQPMLKDLNKLQFYLSLV